MVTNRRHSGQKTKKDLRLVGKRQDNSTTGNTIITTLQEPNHNFGKDEYVVDMTGQETHYWQGTESGLLGEFEFQGTCTAGDGSCDTGSKSMGTGFGNFNRLGLNTQTPLPPSSLQDQHTLNSRKVGREYLTDSETILQTIHRWIGCGVKLNLSKSPDQYVLKNIIIKLQKRVLVGTTTLLVKVNVHRTNRTIYRWKVGQHTRSTTWTNTVRNRFRQKTGEIEVFRALEIGTVKWCKEHIPHKGNDLNDITEGGISLLDDMELCWEKQDLLWACHTARTKDTVNIDGSFRLHQSGVISKTFTINWYLRKGESRDKMGE